MGKSLEALEKVKPAKLEADKKFWKIRSDGEGNFKGFLIDLVKFLDVVYDMGFRRYDSEAGPIFIKITNHRILKQVRRTIIEDAFFDWMKEEYGEEALGQTPSGKIFVEDLINAVLKMRTTLFNEDFLFRIRDHQTFEFNKDTKEIKFMYFQNGFVEITKDGYDLFPYDKLRGFIWENEIMKKEFRMPKGGKDMQESYFEKFLLKVCRDDSKRLHSLKSITGYILHCFTYTKLPALVLTDSTVSQEDEANGRTGKTLYCKAIGYVISPDPNDQSITTFLELNGKDFDPRNKNKYQQASIDTKVVAINDLRRNFDIEHLYNDISEGITVEKKNMNPFRVRPKIIITTNKTIKAEGDSGRSDNRI
jgi:hypothetical protein